MKLTEQEKSIVEKLCRELERVRDEFASSAIAADEAATVAALLGKPDVEFTVRRDMIEARVKELDVVLAAGLSALKEKDKTDV